MAAPGCDKKRFDVKEFYIADNFLLVECRQVWLSPSTDSLCEAYVSGMYRIENGKAKEVWLMSRADEDSYIDMNDSFEGYHKKYELKSFNKKSFFQYLDDFEYFYQKKRIDFTKREQEVLFYYLRGLSSKEIAKEMDLSHRTIESHIASIYEKSDCNSKSDLRNKLFPEIAG